MNSEKLEAWSPRILSVLRIVAGLLLLEHGTQKLLGFPPPTRGMPELLSLMGLAGAIELVGGALLVFGFLTRPVAFVCSGFTAVAYFMAHAPRDFFPVLNGGDSAILYTFIFLYLVVAGGGVWSLDALRAKSAADQ